MLLILASIAVVIIAAISAYTLGPYLWGYCTRRVLRQGSAGTAQVALTFDDGPDPQYTPRCLEILQAHGVHATFFLMGKKVRMYPELTRSIQDHGHDVGNHTGAHLHHWIIGPLRSMRDVREGAKEIAQALGTNPRYFRPSFGVMNLFTYWQAQRLGQRCILWSVEAFDWLGGSGGRSAADIASTVRASLQGGSIVLLHDSGGAEGAPGTMLEALPDIISDARRRGLEPVALREMLGKMRA
jgi:peptidoglycan/xylan/chitin deacetylase (PgdA/CDA1 family)